MPRTLNSVEQNQSGGARGLQCDISSGDENFLDDKQIPTTQTETGGGETRTSTKGPHQKGGPRKSQSEGEREEDIKSRGGRREEATGRMRTLQAHTPTGRHKERSKHDGRDMTLARGLKPDKNQVSGGGGGGGPGGGGG